jgi:hypothetical protein
MATAIFNQHGQFSAAVELRQLFHGIVDNAQAQLCVRTYCRVEAAVQAAASRKLRRGKPS